MTRAIVLNPNDNVATLIDDAAAGAEAELTGEGSGTITILADIPYGHKCAVVALKSGTDILKYGQVIGRATADIAVGDHVHIHNVEALRARGDR
ncbi:UxaA family hydrolase [Aquibium sp. A9E412]|uniref:UxaA family hydrolase n=1 Tax=Aquibium sp. A9E412 TaxID=2976767 RepID=UPI0025B02F20|nr:UxaA family hydrolase [Aquibium sp. A9E412]MDN2568074.1 UxaA family hydrolase [Aquibium sp. A9E412]